MGQTASERPDAVASVVRFDIIDRLQCLGLVRRFAQKVDEIILSKSNHVFQQRCQRDGRVPYVPWETGGGDVRSWVSYACIAVRGVVDQQGRRQCALELLQRSRALLRGGEARFSFRFGPNATNS